MLPSIVGEHKADIGLAALGAGLGTLTGSKLYNVTPTKMVKYIPENGKIKPYITDRFVKYTEKVSLKDLYANVDPHTERSWLRHRREIIEKNASKAMANPQGAERWQFQKIYDLGLNFLTNRKEVPKADIGLARRGANAIQYGRMIEKRNHMIACAAIFATAAVLIKNGIQKINELNPNSQK